MPRNQRSSRHSIAKSSGSAALPDRWHYLDYRSESHDENYIEWKYFNFVQPDLAGFIVYYIVDPEQHTRVGGGRVMARVFHRDMLTGAIRQIPVDKIQFDSITADAQMDDTHIKQPGEMEYEIAGRVEGIDWDLAYAQGVPSIEALDNIGLGTFPWERLNWFIKMPKASVTGALKLAGKKVAVNARGYSDTNWGKIIPFFMTYDWGQFNGGNLSFVFAQLLHHHRTNELLYLFLKDEPVALKGLSVELKHTRWKTYGASTVKIPVETKYQARAKGVELTWTSTLVHSDLLALRISPLLPKPMVSEQIVRYAGTLKRTGKKSISFDGVGFKEWSTFSYAKTPIVF